MGSIRRTPEGLSAFGYLLAVDPTHPIATLKGTTKAIRVEMNAMGDLLVIGGKPDLVATAAVMKDLEHILRSSNHSLVTDPSSTNESSS